MRRRLVAVAICVPFQEVPIAALITLGGSIPTANGVAVACGAAQKSEFARFCTRDATGVQPGCTRAVPAGETAFYSAVCKRDVAGSNPFLGMVWDRTLPPIASYSQLPL